MIDIHPFPTPLIPGKTDAGSTLKNFAATRQISKVIPSFDIAEIVLAILDRREEKKEPYVPNSRIVLPWQKT